MKRFFAGCNIWGWVFIISGIILILFNVSLQFWLALLGFILTVLGYRLCFC